MSTEIHCPKCASVSVVFSYPLRLVIKGGRERYLIVIDALDEAGEAGRKPIEEMLARNAQHLPDWFGHKPIFRTN